MILVTTAKAIAVARSAPLEPVGGGQQLGRPDGVGEAGRGQVGVAGDAFSGQLPCLRDDLRMLGDPE